MNDRLRNKIENKTVQRDNGCIEWAGFNPGRPTITVGGVRYNVLRELWKDKYGAQTAPGMIHTSCGNPNCVNQDHIVMDKFLHENTVVNDSGEYVLNEGAPHGRANIQRKKVWMHINGREPNGYLKRTVANRLCFNPLNATDDAAEVFSAHTTRNDQDCWLWQGARNNAGYGVLMMMGIQPNERMAHRLAYILFNGPIEEGKEVAHTCHNGHLGCVNPAHLELVTHQENIQQAADLNRMHNYLTKEQKKAIYDLKNSDRKPYEIGEEFGISGVTVCCIWREGVEEPCTIS